VGFSAFLEGKLLLMIASFWVKTGICLIIETVVFLGRQNTPPRGHRDDEFLGGMAPSVSATDSIVTVTRKFPLSTQ